MLKMLLLEDDDLSQDVMRRIFKNDFEIDICESADEFYEKHSSAEYDIMIVDVSIKGSINGLEFISKIKNSDQYKNIPVICMTAHAQIKMKQAANEKGADLFLSKPVSNHILREAVASLISKRS